MNKPVLTLGQIIAKINSGAKWTDKTIGYSFATKIPVGGFPNGESTGLTTFSSAQQNATRLAMELWSDLIDINLVETNENRAEILLTNYTDAGLAYAYYPNAGDIFINPDQQTNTELNYGQYGFETLIHEIGHALGLDHPGNYNAGDGNLSYQNNAEYQQDSRQYSVMSYWEASNTGASHGNLSSSTPLLHDIATIQAIYGASTTTRTGDTVYGFNSTANRDVFQFKSNSAPVFAIWDSAGNDTLDASGYFQNATINLAGGSFSNIGGLTENIAIAFNASIENAIGGGGNDIITGQSLANILRGGNGNDRLIGLAGNDTLDGGNGTDLAAFSGSIKQYSILSQGSNSYQLTGIDGVDTLVNIEMLKFSDTADISLAQAISQLSPTDNNDSAATAQTITAGSTSQASIGQNDVRDFYQITALVNSTLDIKLSDDAANSQLNVYDSQLQLLGSSSGSIKQITQKNQQYFIEVVSDQNTTSDYQITTQYDSTDTQNNALLLTVALFNAAPGADFLALFNTSLNSGTSLNVLAAQLATTTQFESLYATTLSNLEFSQQFIESLTASEVSTANKTWASNWFNEQLSNGASRADTMLLTASALKNFSANDTQWGLAQQAFTNKIAVAKWYSLDKNLSGNDLSGLQAVISSVTSDNSTVTAATGIAAQNLAQSNTLPLFTAQAAPEIGIVGMNSINENSADLMA